MTSIFSNEDLEYLLHHPEVLTAQQQVATQGRVYFSIPLTDSIRATLHERLGIDLSHVTSIPMRWIKGDTAPHIDRGAHAFQQTHLVYLHDNPGEMVIGDQSYPITANTAYTFNEGVRHYTQNTGTEPRLLLGPMSEHAEPVGSTIVYYNNYADAVAMNGNTIAYQSGNWILGDPTYLVGNITGYTSWRIAAVPAWGYPIPTGVYPNGYDLTNLGLSGWNVYVYVSAPCFLQGTKILCLVNGVPTEKPIETLTHDSVVKTSLNGYKRVAFIGKGTIQNPATTERLENRLYKCSPMAYPTLTEDLYLTGCHSILVDHLTAEQRKGTVKALGDTYITDKKYRLMAYLDEKAQPWESEGEYVIWHVALENDNDRANYGIYANGLLVESCSKRFMRDLSNMTLL